jgi:hypothetical protein
MENTNITKKKVTITLDIEILDQLKGMNTKVSTLINNLLASHLSLYSNHQTPETDNRMVPSSNLGQVIFSKQHNLRVEEPYYVNSYHFLI